MHKVGQQSDFDRPLSKLGQRQVRRSCESILQTLKNHSNQTKIIASNSLRTTQTSQLLHQIWLDQGIAGEALQAEYATELYLPAPGTVMKWIESHFNKNQQNLILIGHNPAWSEVCSQLADRVIHLATAEAVCFDRLSNSNPSSDSWKFIQKILPS